MRDRGSAIRRRQTDDSMTELDYLFASAVESKSELAGKASSMALGALDLRQVIYGRL